jgi:hypothetical protein
MKLRVIGSIFILTCLFFSASGQKTSKKYNYAKVWQKIGKIDHAKKPKSGLELSREVLQHARQEKNSPQTIKALMAIEHFNAEFEPKADSLNIRLLENAIREADAPEKAILENLLAGNYQAYYNSNTYRINERTPKDSAIRDSDFYTWDATRFRSKIMNLALSSVAQKEILQKIPVRGFAAILDTAYHEVTLRPMLYDLLMHNCIGYFTVDNQDLFYKPYDSVQVYTYRQFLALDIKAQRWYVPSNFYVRALMLYRDLEEFHKNDEKPDAFVALDIERLKYIRDHSESESKEKDYYEALLALEEHYSNDPTSAEPGFERAKMISNGYRPGPPDEPAKFKKIIALDICEAYIKKYPNSFGGKNCARLKELILQPWYQPDILEYVLPGKPNDLMFNYKNLDKIYYRVIALTDKQIEKEKKKTYTSEILLKTYLKSPVLKSGSFDLALPPGHEKHEAEVELPALDPGNYILITCAGEKFTNKNSQYGKITVTGMKAFIRQALTNEKPRLYVVDAENGAPVAGAKVFIKLWTYKGRVRTQYLVTDNAGMVQIDSSNSESYENIDYTISKGKDKLIIKNNSLNNYHHDESFEDTFSITTHLYTDRALYRPGQTVYFKGIMVKTNADHTKSAVMPGKKNHLTLEDANGTEIDSVDVKTNAFGSFAGSFKLPAKVLNGNFEISDNDNNGRVNFSVEEYKRPKFEIRFLPVYTQFKIYDSVTVEGTAISYAGSALDQSRVSYTVKINSTANQAQLAFGNVKTDANGHFRIRFKAEPYRKNNDWAKKGVYSYEVEATITDINGETHSLTTTIYAGKEALEVAVSVPNWVNGSDTLILKPSVENRNYVPVAGTGVLRIDRIKEPVKPYPANDVLTGQSDDDVDFQNEPEAFEPDKDKNQPEDEIDKNYFSVNTAANQEIKINQGIMQNLPQGVYRVTYTLKDSFGNEVTASSKFTIYKPESELPAVNQLAYMVPVRTEDLQPGQNAQLIVGSAVHAYFHIIGEHDGKILLDKIIEINHNQKIVNIPIVEAYRGGLKIAIFTAVNNRKYLRDLEISIPFESKDLEIKATVFHSSLEPGQKETWKLNIRGPKAQKVRAELMATLYDASLDAMRGNNWNLLNNPPRIYNSLSVSAILNENPVLFSGDGADFRTRNWYWILTDHSFDQIQLNFGLTGKRRWVLRGGSWKDVGYYDWNFGDGSFEVINRNAYAVPGVYALDGVTTTLNYSVMYSVSDKTPPMLKLEGVSPLTVNVLSPYDNGLNTRIIPRKNLQELAFFYPQLKTDDSGNVEFSFTMPEALTRWHLMAFAHTKDVLEGFLSQYTVTQKQLMVQPNAPRFLREGDEIDFSAKLSNMSEKPVDATVKLELLNVSNDKIINDQLAADPKTIIQKIHINAKGSNVVSWKLKIPKGMDGFIYRITAAALNFTDGEEGMIPVLPARILVTEATPLFVRGNQTKTFDLKNIRNYPSASGLSPYRVSMEMTANPAWYAIQALPYLMEFPHECNEQLFNRFFANTMASYITQKEPKIKEVFDTWKKTDGKALESNLEKNESVKNILLNETPWVRDAENESARKKRIGLLFDDSTVNKGMNDAITKLEQNQLPDGSWPWFPGMPGNRYITGYICSCIGRLEKMGVETAYTDRLRVIGVKAFKYLDKKMKDDYDAIISSKQKRDEDHLTPDIVTYLYARTFWKVPLELGYEKALYFWLQQATNHWQNVSLLDQAMLVSALYRQDEEPAARKIWNSIDERALHSDEMGMYWKENTGGYGLRQNDIQTEAMLIEAYSSMLHTNLQPLEEMKLWLLKHKQTHNWNSTIATADAVYCLLLRGKDPIATDKQVQISLGTQSFDSKTAEAGTGYFSHVWQAGEITPQLGKVTVEKKDDGIAWGAVYFQYYQDLDKIKTFSGPINIRKEVYLQENTANGPVLKPITNTTTLKTGDLVKIRIEIRTDRDMEYIHLKDLRAGAFEPVEQLSGYNYIAGLGYYQEIKDASMNFFFDHIAPGTYVFEYNLRATQTGTFQNGIATIENMYAPEFKSHSDGVVIEVK